MTRNQSETECKTHRKRQKAVFRRQNKSIDGIIIHSGPLLLEQSLWE
jgi:hypothetical protein